VAYTWPGNVRELRNTLVRAVALATPPVTFERLVFNLGPAPEQPSTIGMSFPGLSPPLPYKEAKGQLLASFERAYLESLLERHRGNVTQAAAAAGLSRKHLHELIRRVNGEGGDEDPSG
jgi:DNA-binding NtrC family response regulator